MTLVLLTSGLTSWQDMDLILSANAASASSNRRFLCLKLSTSSKLWAQFWHNIPRFFLSLFSTGDEVSEDAAFAAVKSIEFCLLSCWALNLRLVAAAADDVDEEDVEDVVEEVVDTTWGE